MAISAHKGLNTITSFLMAMLRLFQNNFVIIKATSSEIRQSSTFSTRANFLEQLFLQSSSFFEEFHFQNSHILAAIIFSEQLFFQSKSSMEQPLVRTESYLAQVQSPFQNMYLFAMKFVKIKMPQKSYFFEVGSSAQHQLFSEEL